MKNYICPCKIADKPCQPNCTCVKPYMSHGCYCCATYGSAEQRKAAANRIVSMLSNDEQKKTTKFSIQTGHECTGRVLFQANETDEQDDRYFGFMCGKEIKEGFVDDQHDPKLYDEIEAILIAAGFEQYRLDIGASEVEHLILLKGETHEAVWERVKSAFLNAGAVEMTW